MFIYNVIHFNFEMSMILKLLVSVSTYLPIVHSYLEHDNIGVIIFNKNYYLLQFK